jgi:hypothetical protein
VAVYSTGDRVSQLHYGDGTVLSCNEHHTIIDFDAHGSRTFVTRLARLESCSTVAPIKLIPTRRRKPRTTN